MLGIILENEKNKVAVTALSNEFVAVVVAAAAAAAAAVVETKPDSL